MKLVLATFTVVLLSLGCAAAAQVPAQPPAPPTSGVADFKITTQPDTVSVKRGSAVQIKVKIEPVSGFRGKVQLLSSLLYGTATTFQPVSVDSGSGSDTATLTIAPGPTALRGSYVVTITGVGTAVSHTITLPVRIR